MQTTKASMLLCQVRGSQNTLSLGGREVSGAGGQVGRETEVLVIVSIHLFLLVILPTEGCGTRKDTLKNSTPMGSPLKPVVGHGEPLLKWKYSLQSLHLMNLLSHECSNFTCLPLKGSNHPLLPNQIRTSLSEPGIPLLATTDLPSPVMRGRGGSVLPETRSPRCWGPCVFPSFKNSTGFATRNLSFLHCLFFSPVSFSYAYEHNTLISPF